MRGSMRILDLENDKVLTSVLIMLTPEEAHELLGSIRSIKPEIGDHIHVNDQNFLREITIAIYTPNNLKYFNERVREIINNGSD
jgi:hypothetical protein